MKIILLYITALFNSGFAQDEFTFYKKMYAAADSITATGSFGKLDQSIFEVASSLDSTHPAEIIVKSQEFMMNSMFNEGSFLFYVGYMRYKYYNKTNPAYSPSEDGALLGSLNYTIGESVRLFLKASIDNYISILKSSINYYGANEYKFYSRSINPNNFDTVSVIFTNLHDDIVTNRTTYEAQWKAERTELEKNLDAYLNSPEYKKQKKKQKKQKKQQKQK